MSAVCKVSRPHGADDRMSLIELVNDELSRQGNLLHVQPQLDSALGHQRPGRAYPIAVIALFLGKVSHIQRAFIRVTGQTTIHHRQTGRAAASDGDHITAVLLIPPTLIPL